MNNKKILVVFLLDRSGSMSTIQADMIGGFNRFIQEQCKDDIINGTTTYCSLYRFDTEYEFVFENLPIQSEVVQLNNKNFVPRGCTSLYDSMCKCIDDVGRGLAALPEKQRPSKVVFVTITDGGENSSREFRLEHVATRTKHQQEKYNWQFVYLGANQDSFSTGASLNVNACSTTNFVANSVGVSNAWDQVSRGFSSYKLAASRDAVYSLPNNSNNTPQVSA